VGVTPLSAARRTAVNNTDPFITPPIPGNFFKLTGDNPLEALEKKSVISFSSVVLKYRTGWQLMPLTEA
jgi:hypothetical protein